MVVLDPASGDCRLMVVSSGQCSNIVQAHEEGSVFRSGRMSDISLSQERLFVSEEAESGRRGNDPSRLEVVEDLANPLQLHIGQSESL